MSSSGNLIKAHSLTGRLTDGLLYDGFRAVKRNRGAAGIDKVSIQMFEGNLEDNLQALLRELKQGAFQPHPLRRAYVPKNETEFRPLGIPAVKDRAAQEAVRRLLSPIFEPAFHDASYGFRPGRNGHQAIEEALRLHEIGLVHVLDADIKGFFDNLPHDVIMAAVAALGALGLQLSPEKTRITTYGKGDSFLGFILSRRSRRIRPKSVKKFKDKVRELTPRSHNFDAVVIERLNRVIRGTALYFATGFFTARHALHPLDSWIRMRRRCMKTKRKSRHDNRKIPVKRFARLGLLTLESFLPSPT